MFSVHNLRVQEKILSTQDKSVLPWAGMQRGEELNLPLVSLLALCHFRYGPGSTLSALYLNLGLERQKGLNRASSMTAFSLHNLLGRQFPTLDVTSSQWNSTASFSENSTDYWKPSLALFLSGISRNNATYLLWSSLLWFYLTILIAPPSNVGHAN